MIVFVFVFGMATPFSFLNKSFFILSLFSCSILADTVFFQFPNIWVAMALKSEGRLYFSSVLRILLNHPVCFVLRAFNDHYRFSIESYARKEVASCQRANLYIITQT